MVSTNGRTDKLVLEYLPGLYFITMFHFHTYRLMCHVCWKPNWDKYRGYIEITPSEHLGVYVIINLFRISYQHQYYCNRQISRQTDTRCRRSLLRPRLRGKLASILVIAQI